MTDNTIRTATDIIVPTRQNGEVIEYDDNVATLPVTLFFIGEWVMRTPQMRMIVCLRAVLAGGKTVVESTLVVAIFEWKAAHPGHALCDEGYDFTICPCPPAKERFDAFNAKLAAAGFSQIKDVTMTVVLAATYIVNPAVVVSRLNDLFNSMIQPFKEEDLARQLTQDSGCDGIKLRACLLPTAEPPDQVGAAQGAGPAAEGVADGPIAHRLRPSSRKPAGYYKA